jgi:hypothetical protein
MPKVAFDLETALPPERVTAMLTDFSERRPHLWPRLWKDAYEVYSVSETSAEIREGNRSPRIWARERYDWSRPGVIRWEVVESNFCVPGGFIEVTVTPSDSGGTRLHVHWNRSPSSLVGALVTTLIKVTGGAPVKRSFHAGFKQAEKS